MSLSLRLVLDGDERALGLLDGIRERLADMTPLMAAIAGLFRISTRQRFEDQTGPDGARWKPSIRAQLTGGVTLTHRGILRDSFIDRYTATTAEVGTSDIRARPLHFGATIRPVNAEALVFQLPGGGWRRVKEVTLPARPILGVSTDDRGDIEDLGKRFLAGELA